MPRWLSSRGMFLCLVRNPVACRRNCIPSSATTVACAFRCGRAVPGLHQAGVVFVEGAALGIHQRVAGPGFRDQHHHGVGKAVATRQQQFERVVEAGGVRLAVRDQRPHLVEIGVEL